MPVTLDASGIATQALRKIQVISPYEDGIEDQRHEIALQWLDLIVAELAGTKRYWWLVPDTAEIALVEGQRVYNIANLTTPSLDFVFRAFRRDGASGEDEEIELIRRLDYEQREDKDEQGQVKRAHITREPEPKMYVHPVPMHGQDSIRLFGQRHAPDATQSQGATPHGFPPEWQRYLITRLAYELAQGPVVRWAGNELERLRVEAQEIKRDLDSWSAREQVDRPRFTAYRDF